MKIILLGPPGAGKGTQAEFICRALGVVQISTGEMLRAAIAAGTGLGRKVREIVAAGEFVPDDTVVALVRERITADDCRRGFLLDGFPRNIPQAQAMLDAGIEIDHVVEIQVSEAVLVRRISGRRIHEASGRTYHVNFDPPRVPGKDDVTGEPLVQRADDNDEVVRERLRIYREQTRPLVRFYKDLAATSNTRYSAVSGDGTVTEVQDAMRTFLSAAMTDRDGPSMES